VTIGSPITGCRLGGMRLWPNAQVAKVEVGTPSARAAPAKV
jgi:hypothetical protein